MATQARPRFIQIHTLTSYAGVLLNRDDSGMAKRLPFGGATRTRVSSQCLKRHWRFAGQEDHAAAAKVGFSLQSLGVPMGERTKELVTGVIMPAAAKAHPQATPEQLQQVSDALHAELYGKSGADAKKRQALFFGQPEIDYLTEFAARALSQSLTAEQLKASLKETRANMAALKDAAGLESALFGRMVTSDVASNKDAPIHVAHALTVHAMERDLDFVTAVDDLRQRDPEAESGSAGMFDIELTSGVFYGYVNIDVDLLVKNLGGDAKVAGDVVGRLVNLIAKVSPGAKKGSTAPFAAAEFMLVEVTDEQPRSLVNAFRKPVPLKGDVFQAAIHALGSHLASLDAAYDSVATRGQMVAGMTGIQGPQAMSVNGLAEFASNAVKTDASAAVAVA
jgi:CRISPR system Cascade subunit CasC